MVIALMLNVSLSGLLGFRTLFWCKTVTLPFSIFHYGSHFSMINLRNNQGKLIPSSPKNKAERILHSVASFR